MNLDLFNTVLNDTKNNKPVLNIIKELQKYLENDIFKNNYINTKKEDFTLVNSSNNDNKIIAKYKDMMNLERHHILINYAKQTLDKGQMYYIYDNNSNMSDVYNLCICEEGNSHTIIEAKINELPYGAKIGSVLRYVGNRFLLDEEATKIIEQEIFNMKTKLLEEQKEFLESKRIEGHIYEMGENEGDRVWLYDITNESNQEIEGVEEIDFPKELLEDGKEGDLYIFKNGEYQKKR